MNINSTLLDQLNHDLIDFKSGAPFSSSFKPPLIVELDEEFINGEMATLYLLPAFIAKKSFYLTLQSLGLLNIQAYDVIIKDKVNNLEIHDYTGLNIIGRVACADMGSSDYKNIAGNMSIIDNLILDGSKIQDEELFLVDEDTNCIVISERIFETLYKKSYHDIYFEELKVI